MTTLSRDDVDFLGVPLARMCNENFRDSRERILMKNIAYAGALVAILNIDMAMVEQLLDERFASKKALARIEHDGAAARIRIRQEHFPCPLPFHLERMDANGDKILIDGNTAAALGCVYAGATVAAWYPITPATSVMDAFKEFCERYRKDPKPAKQLRDPPGRRRNRGDRHGDRRDVERRARIHVNRRPGHLADERALGPRLLRRDSCRRYRCAARRSVHRHADAHPAGRYSRVRLRIARRYQTYPSVPRKSGRVFRVRAAMPSILPSASRRRCSCCPTSTSA